MLAMFAKKKSFRNTKKVYRIALYGHSGSGKTCVLAALAMERVPHPAGFTGTWLTSGQEEGQDWLKKATHALEEYKLPPPNPTGQHLSFDFTFSADGRDYPVEMIDYAGELVNPALSDTDNGRLLRDHLKGMDALLILAPISGTQDSEMKLSDDLLAITRTFKSLCDEVGEHQTQLNKPVGLLINMWDRMLDTIPDTQPQPVTGLGSGVMLPNNDSISSVTAHEQERLRQFLFERNPLPPHRNLYNALKNSLPESDVAIFPISAIGVCERAVVDGTSFERPKQIKPLHSIGLEDPFIWALQRRDELDIEHLDREVQQLTTTPYSWALPFPPWRLLQDGKALLRRFPHDSALYQTTHQKIHQLRRLFWQRFGMGFTYVFLAILTTEAIMDASQHRSVNAAWQNPQATVEQLQQAEQWLENYHNSSFIRHRFYKLFRLNLKAAGDELRDFHGKREDLFVEPLRQATSLEQKAQAAKDYLDAFPNGKHRAKAHEAIQSYEFYQQKTDWQKVIGASTNEEKAKWADEYLKKHPYSGDRAMNARQIISENANAKDWADFELQYDQMIAARRLSDAVVLLNTRQPEIPKLVELKQRFPELAQEKLRQAAHEKISNRDWEEGLALLDEADRWPPALMNEELKEGISKIRQEFRDTWDQAIYQDVLSRRTRDSMEEYLRQAPLGTMRRQVQAYLDYLNKLGTGELDLKIELVSVTWGRNANQKSKTSYEIRIDGKRVINVPFDNGPPSRRNETSHINRESSSFQARLKDEINLFIKIKGDGFFGKAELGESRVSLPVASLQSGYTLRVSDKDGATSELMLALRGLPEAPNLPSWQK